MMEEKHTVIGCGAGTTTKVVFPAENRVERQENIKNIQEYLPDSRRFWRKNGSFCRNGRAEAENPCKFIKVG